MSSIASVAPKNWKELRRHEFSAIFGDMSDVESHMIESDMAENGWRGRPILIYEGQVADGWHQLNGAIKNKLLPIFEEFRGTPDEAFAECYRRNAVRRHYDTSQRAMIAAKIATRGKGPKSEKFPKSENLPTQQNVASTLSVSDKSVREAKKVVANGTPALQQAVVNGTVSVSDAAKVASEPPKVQNQAVKDVANGKAPTATKAAQAASPKPKKNGTPAYDDRIIDGLIGKLTRALDDRAGALGKCSEHTNCIAAMNSLVQRWQQWQSKK